MHIYKSHGIIKLQREITLIALAPSSYIFLISICLEDRNVFARFDEIPLMTLRTFASKCSYVDMTLKLCTYFISCKKLSLKE